MAAALIVAAALTVAVRPVAVGAVVAPPTSPPTVQTPVQTTVPVGLPTPQEYVAIAMDFVLAYAYRVPTVDFSAIRARAEQRAAVALTIADTYPIIVEALKALGDNHSTFERPPEAAQTASGRYEGFGFTAVWPQRTVIVVAPGSPAAAAGLRVGDRVDRVDGKTPRGSTGVIAVPRDRNGQFPSRLTLSVKRPGVRKSITITIGRGEVTLVSVPRGSVLPNRVLPGRIAYLEVPGIVGDPSAQTAYATQLQQTIRDEDGDTRCGWVVDLRRNRGGYIYAMLAGLGPLAGDGSLGGQLAADGKVTAWVYAAGTLRVGDQPTVSVANPYVLLHTDVPVAVLTSGLTASAGEASVIAFAQRPNTRRFGEATLGLTTFNIQRNMPDAAVLVVTNAVDVDRAGKAYDGPIPPDVAITNDWNHVGDDADPVLNSAVQWLASGAACATQ